MLLLTTAGCGRSGGADPVGDDDRDSEIAEESTGDEPNDELSYETNDESSDEPGDSTGDEPNDELSDWIDVPIPELPAPNGLASAVLPTDADGVVAVFAALPAELIGGRKDISAHSPGQFAAEFAPPGRASRTGLQAYDLDVSQFGSMLPEPTAEMVVTLFASGADWDVLAAGHEGSLYWVAWYSTGSGYGVDGIEDIYSLTWGRADSPLAFIAAAPTEDDRDELVLAFVEASNVAAAAAAEPATPDESAAQAALLTEHDFGDGWLTRPNLPRDGTALHEMMSGAMIGQPSCRPALEWIERENVVLSGLLDVLAVGSVARVESATFIPGLNQMSSVQHTVLVFENTEQLDAMFRSLREAQWEDCRIVAYDELAQAQYTSAFPGIAVSVTAAEVRPLELGDDATALRFEVTLLAPGDDTAAVISQDISVVAVGRAVSALAQDSFEGGIDEGQRDDLIALAVASLTEQFGTPDEGGS
jgi:hypothetical protein